jgi:DNA polymerase-1
MFDTKTLYLIDGTAYIHRAYHAVKGLATSRGVPTNAVFGFANILVRLMEEKKPEYAAMVFDAKGPTHRHQRYSLYKANRPPMPEDMRAQIGPIRDITRAFNFPVLEVPGFEADDVIGTLARQAEKAGFDTVIVSGDKDMNQLVSPAVTVWDPMRDRVMDLAAVRAAFGLEPAQLIEVMGFMGDASDNVPGVPKIGEKTALALIQEHGSMDGVYAALSEMKAGKHKETIAANKELAYLSRELVTIHTGAPVTFSPEEFRLKGPDRAALSLLFREYEFRQFQAKFHLEEDPKEVHYHTVLDREALLALAETLKTAGAFAVDTETTSTHPVQARLVGMSFAVRPLEAWYVPMAHSCPDAPAQVPVAEALEILRPVLEDPGVVKIGQNAKYDMIVLARHGVRLQGLARDTMVASYLLNPSQRSHGLDQIALDHLGHKNISYEEVCGKGAKAVTFDKADIKTATDYAAEDADVCLRAWEVFAPRLAEEGLTELFDTLEMPLVPVLADMEARGVRVDTKALQEFSLDLEQELGTLETEIYSLAGESFNIASTQQLGRVLFEKLNLPTQKKTKKKTGYSTDESVLLTLAALHPLPKILLRHRTLAKLKGTYADALGELVNPETGRVHTSFNQAVTATGRLSSSDPNLQNIPARTPEGRRIRKAFLPEPGWKMFAADYSQIELRILAHYSKDPVLLKAYKTGEDIHLRTASEVFELSPQFVTPDMRRQAKTINFGIIYGMSPFRLAQEQGITRKTAKRYIENYFRTYEGVRAFIEATKEEARRTGRVATLAGRTRRIPEINSADRTAREAAERMAVNTPIQGTAADFIKTAMVRVHRALQERGMRAAMLLTVHDELVFEAPPEELEEAMALVKERMEGVWRLDVPLEVSLGAGDNWEVVH